MIDKLPIPKGFVRLTIIHEDSDLASSQALIPTSAIKCVVVAGLQCFVSIAAESSPYQDLVPVSGSVEVAVEEAFAEVQTALASALGQQDVELLCCGPNPIMDAILKEKERAATIVEADAASLPHPTMRRLLYRAANKIRGTESP